MRLLGGPSGFTLNKRWGPETRLDISKTVYRGSCDSPGVKTVRFAKVVETAGRPDTYLLLAPPKKDPKFQRALKAHRVVTIFQATRAHKADYGEVGFAAGSSRQFLMFPKSAGRFSGQRIVGIKYDLLAAAPVAKNRVDKRSRSEKKMRVGSPAPHRDPPSPPLVAEDKVVSFPRADSPEEDGEDSGEIAEIKAQVRRALSELEKGRQIAAFRLLQRIVGE
jgi:hypothetical protein